MCRESYIKVNVRLINIIFATADVHWYTFLYNSDCTSPFVVHFHTDAAADVGVANTRISRG